MVRDMTSPNDAAHDSERVCAVIERKGAMRVVQIFRNAATIVLRTSSFVKYQVEI